METNTAEHVLCRSILGWCLSVAMAVVWRRETVCHGAGVTDPPGSVGTRPLVPTHGAWTWTVLTSAI